MIPAVLFRPGKVALDYVEGKRKRYFNIFQYLILIVGLNTFLIAKTGMMDAMMGTFSDAKQSARITTMQNEMSAFMKEYLNLVMFALIPAYAFISWRLFKKKEYNYAENIVLHVSIQAQISTWSFLIILPIAYFVGEVATIPLTVGGFIFLFTSFTVANRQFFKVSWGEALFKGILIYLLTYFLQVILIAIVIGVLISTKSY